jgi:hypothetical protein
MLLINIIKANFMPEFKAIEDVEVQRGRANDVNRGGTVK